MAITTQTMQTLQYLRSDLITVPHGFTTRAGGVGTGVFESLNLGMHRGDAPQNVAENFHRLGAAIGFSTENAVLTRQVHGDTVRVVTRADCRGLDSHDYPDSDALVTATAGVALVIFTADCTPILLHDPVTGAVGAAHAGWRGTAADIVGKTVQAMTRHFGCKAENIRAAIGPNIGACHFETDADVAQALTATFGAEISAFIDKRGEKLFPDLKQINAFALRRAGVKEIDISDICTFCANERFWSHRFTGGVRGSQGAVIVCKGGLG